MSNESDLWRVVINLEEQYSIMPEDEQNPEGWTNVGIEGTKAECLAYILEVWQDMRPLSLRKRMDDMLSRGKAN